jgi:hypothetical protein
VEVEVPSSPLQRNGAVWCITGRPALEGARECAFDAAGVHSPPVDCAPPSCIGVPCCVISTSTAGRWFWICF